jgi:5-methylcytosine-specific restriction enzyme A
MGKTWKPDPSSWRTAPRPKGWKSVIVPAVKLRDGSRCTWIEGVPDGGTWRMWADPRRCPAFGVDVDHMGAPDDHRIENLRLLCEAHHDSRSGKQANAARWARHRALARRPEPKHPGLRHAE